MKPPAESSVEPIVEEYFKPYGDIELQRRMVSDQPRTDAFAHAIHEVIRADDVVLDVGTGTGVLAMLAAKAGARQVVGVDHTDIADVAMELVAANGLGDRVQIVHGRADELRLEQKANVIISEWLGNFAFVEGMLDTVVAARENNLAPQGRMMPAKVRVLLAPLDDPLMFNSEGPGFWRRPIHGLDFRHLQEVEFSQGRTVQIQLQPAAMLAHAQPLIELELTTATSDDAWAEGRLSFVATRDGVLNGFAAWFEADLSENVTLDTGPRSPETHWAQTYMSFRPRHVKEGEVFEVEFAFSHDPNEIRRSVDVTLAVGEDRLSYAIE